MPQQVLIVAGEAAARQPVEVARSLQLEPVVVATEEEAFQALSSEEFSLVAVRGR